MWAWLFNATYLSALAVWTPVALWQRWVQGKRRGGWNDRFWGPQLPVESLATDGKSAPTVWLHAVSVGEVNLLVALLPALKERYPGYRFAISTTTDTGLTLARQRFPSEIVFRFPLDFSWAIAKVLRQLKPAAVVLAELEIWPNMLSQLQRARVPVIVVNGRLSEKSFARYRWGKSLMVPIFRNLSLVLPQTEGYRERFVELGVPKKRCRVVGSIKFDAAQFDRQNPATQGLRTWAGISDQDLIWLAGSTSAPEEEIVLQVFQQLRAKCPRLRLVLVPRHRERFEEVAKLCSQTKLTFIRRSQVSHEATQHWEILLVDTIGELSAWWGVADLGFVGGSMGARGGQSMIEPSGYGVAISFGPNTANFRDVVSMLRDAEAAVVVRNVEEMQAFVQRCCMDENYRSTLGQRAQEIAKSQTGATTRTIEALAPYLPRS
ncbi:MAG: 3-deoxy-D-manno-octulosonic acid transferase [Pirellulaceae bacterium]|nr:3-deoxy-D-manno-octulosonic acid transferase [Pirellulaceae bacterium]